MCIGIPMQIISVDGLAARCEGHGRIEDINLALTGPLESGTYILAHLGSAIRAISADEARAIENALQAVMHAAKGDSFEHLVADLVDREPELPAHLRASNSVKEGAS